MFKYVVIKYPLLSLKDGEKPKTTARPRAEDAEFQVPHYQRLSTSGEDCTGVPIEDLRSASEMLVQALEIRQKYMKVSHQAFPSFGNRFLAAYKGEVYQKPRGLGGKATLEGNILTIDNDIMENIFRI